MGRSASGMGFASACLRQHDSTRRLRFGALSVQNSTGSEESTHACCALAVSSISAQLLHDFPVTELGAGSVTLALGAQQPAVEPAGEASDVLRWNNYGIALVGQQQYWKAKEAFEKVIELKPGYADAYINVAVVESLTLVDTRRYGGDGPGTCLFQINLRKNLNRH